MASEHGADFLMRAQAWLFSHDTGLSSEAIFHYMTLGVKGGSTPSDASDLGRCVRLLDRFPEWKERMPEMAAVSDDWALLMPHWAALVASYAEEAGGPAPKTYEMISNIFYVREGGFLHRRQPRSDGALEIRMDGL